MRMSTECFDDLRGALKPLDTAERRARYAAGEFPRSDRVNDLDKRYRWDLLWSAIVVGAVPALPDELADAHIDTALRRIVAPLDA